MSSVSRRQFLAAAAVTAGAAVLPGREAFAQRPARFRRMNISESGFPLKVLESYKKAIRAMLALPPNDPRNWYRNALVHTLDCPHGNWWFLVWHRGYIGWFEQICRELSEDPDFALPYWDWTKQPRVPAGMFDDLLTPTNPAYIPTAAEFKTKFQEAVAAFWNGLSGDQFNALLVRGYRFPEDLWFDVAFPGGPMFFDLAIARGLSKDQPDLDARTAKAVSLPTLLNALGPRDFITFGSPKTFSHSGLTGFGVLEGQPHNLVHNCVGGVFNNTGGFMQSNMSPVDPIFFLHHANIDRLWDVWTRKQQGIGGPILPTGSDLRAWSDEDFLFYVNAKGEPVTKTKAGDYAAIGDFNYDYQPGSGEEVVPPPAGMAAIATLAPVQRFPAQMVPGTGGGTVALPTGLVASAGTGSNAARLFAKVTIDLPPLAHGQQLRALVGPAGAETEDAGTLAMFGHHIVTGPVTFTVPLSEPVAALRSRSTGFAAGAPLNIRVVAEQPPAQPGAMRGPMRGHVMRPGVDVTSIVVEAH